MKFKLLIIVLFNLAIFPFDSFAYDRNDEDVSIDEYYFDSEVEEQLLGEQPDPGTCDDPHPQYINACASRCPNRGSCGNCCKIWAERQPNPDVGFRACLQACRDKFPKSSLADLSL